MNVSLNPADGEISGRNLQPGGSRHPGKVRNLMRKRIGGDPPSQTDRRLTAS
jgi:hypothetical protein